VSPNVKIAVGAMDDHVVRRVDMVVP